MAQPTVSNTLFIGLGGTGGRVLKELRKRIYDEVGKIPSGLGFLYVDATEELMRPNNPAWMAKTQKSIDTIASKFEIALGDTEAMKEKTEALNILNKI